MWSDDKNNRFANYSNDKNDPFSKLPPAPWHVVCGESEPESLIPVIIFLLIDWYFLNWTVCRFLWFMVKLSFWISIGWWTGFNFPHFSEFY